MTIEIFFDGACDNNGKKIMGIGVWAKIYSPDTRQVLTEISKSWNTGRGTNNEAEWIGLIKSLQLAQKIEGVMTDHRQAHVFRMFSDSQLIVNQFSGVYKIKQPHLRYYAERAHDEAAKLSTKIILSWIPREHNTQADKLSKEGLTKFKTSI